MSYNSGYATIQVAFVPEEEEEGWGGVGGHDKLCKVFWGVNIFSAPGMGRVSPKLVGQNKNAPILSPPPPLLIFDRSLKCDRTTRVLFNPFAQLCLDSDKKILPLCY